MKDLIKYGNECIEELNAIGIYPNEINHWVVNKRAKRWGMCIRKIENGKKDYTIEVASCLLADDVSVHTLKDTIYHELLHAVDGTVNHGKVWKSLANKVNKAYGYNITCTTSYQELGFLTDPFQTTYHYLIKCNGCGASWQYQRKPRIAEACECGRVSCSCGSRDIVLIKL